MRKAKEFLGLRVLGQEDGSILGMVKDLVLDATGQRVDGFILVADAVPAPGTLVSWDQVVRVSNEDIVVRAAGVDRSQDAAARATGISGQEGLGRQVLTATGGQLGTLADLLIDPLTGRVKGYEVSGDIFKRGRGSS